MLAIPFLLGVLSLMGFPPTAGFFAKYYIFMAAVETGVPVQPVALRYGPGGAGQRAVAFQPRENFAQNFLRLLGEPSRVVEVVFLEPVLPGQAEGRAAIARIARERIVGALQAT